MWHNFFLNARDRLDAAGCRCWNILPKLQAGRQAGHGRQLTGEFYMNSAIVI